MPKPKKIVDPESIEPLCPFTGEKLTLIRHDQTGMWRAQGPFYVTRMFHYKRELVYWLMHVKGVAPDFDSGISVRTIEEPPRVSPVADLVEKQKFLQEVADEYVDVNKKTLGLKK